MKNIGQKAIWFIVFVVAFFIAKYAVTGFRTEHADRNFDNKIEALQQEAESNNPTLSKSDAWQKEGKEQAAKQVANASSYEKKKIAADMFSGFYYVNVKARKEYCDNLGVDISLFISAFKSVNSAEYKIMQSIGALPASELNKLDAQFKSTVNQAMIDASNQYKMTTTQVCEAFQENADAVAKEISFKILVPSAYAALHEQ